MITKDGADIFSLLRQISSKILYHQRDIGSDQYERLSVLRKSHMSEVWLALRKQTGLKTIVKIARLDNLQLASVNQQAILNETRWLKKFYGNRRIVQMYLSAPTNLPGSPYFIAAEYLSGGTLSELLDRKTVWGHLNDFLIWVRSGFKMKLNRTQPPDNLLQVLGIRTEKLYIGALAVEQALQIFQYLAEILDMIHQEGIVHRDIKPDNIMFRVLPQRGKSIDPEGVVLIDFGVASRREAEARVAYSVGWTEPGLIQAKEAGERRVVKFGFDIYGLGQVLRYMLTREIPGDQPRLASTPAVIDIKCLVFNSDFDPALRQEIAQQISTLIEHCLVDNPDDRPSGKELAAQAENLRSKMKPLPKPIPRQRKLAAACILIGLLALLLPFLWIEMFTHPQPPIPTLMPTSTPTSAPPTSTPTAIPTSTPAPTSTPMPTPRPVLLPRMEIIGGNPCHDQDQGKDTWGNQVEVVWQTTNNQPLNGDYRGFEIVMGEVGANFVDVTQAPTIHSADQIRHHGNGKYSIELTPKILIRDLRGKIPFELEKGKTYVWGIVVVDHYRYERHVVTPHSCHFFFSDSNF